MRAEDWFVMFWFGAAITLGLAFWPEPAVPRAKSLAPDYYCLGSPSGDRVYAAGRMSPDRDAAYVLRNGRGSYIELTDLHPCQGEQDT
jgi:hypothetical protein